MIDIWAEFSKFNTSQRLSWISEIDFKERLVIWIKDFRNMWIGK